MIRLSFLFATLLFAIIQIQLIAKPVASPLPYANPEEEILEIQVSKSRFFTGETIWYSVSVFSRQKASAISSIAYVELLNEDGQLAAKQMIRLYGGKGQGSIELPRLLKRGRYRMQCYTAWMQSVSPSTLCKKNLLIESCYTAVAEHYSFAVNDHSPGISAQLIDKSDLKFIVTTPVPSIVRVMVENAILEERNLNAGKNDFMIKVPDEMVQNDFFVGIFSTSDQLLEAKHFSLTEPFIFSLKTNKTLYKPNDLVELDMKLTNQNASFIVADLTVLLHDVTADVEDLNSNKACSWPLQGTSMNNRYGKELLIYPASEFRKSFQMKKVNIQLDSADEKLLPTNMNSLVKQFYDTMQHKSKYNLYRPQADRIYAPADFAPMNSIEDFFSEVVPEVRIKKKKGRKVIQLRNNETPNNLYFYKETPLILVNGYVEGDLNRILDLIPSDIASIEIGFKLSTINNLGINQLADNGFLALYTHDPGNFKASSTIQPFEGLYADQSFIESFSIENMPGDKIPVLRNPIYWNPSFVLNGKGKLSFRLSDDFGDFVLQITGRTNEGDVLNFSTKLVVRPPRQ